MPNPAAINPPVNSTIDGRITCSAAMIKRDDAEHRILEQVGRKRAHLAQHGLQAGVAGQRHGREFDGEVAQIERVADGDEADHQQKLHLIGRQPERSFFHSSIFSGMGPDTKSRKQPQQSRSGSPEQRPETT